MRFAQNRLILSIFTCLAATQSFAEICGDEIRLDRDGGPFEGIPIYDQNIGICYSASASELVDAYRRINQIDSGRREPFVSSPLEAAVQANFRTDGLERDMITGGLVCHVVNSIKDKGSCDISVVEDLIQTNYSHAIIVPLENEYSNDLKSNPARARQDEKEMVAAAQNWDTLTELFNVRSDQELRTKLSTEAGRKELSRFVSNSIARKNGKPLNSEVSESSLENIFRKNTAEDAAYRAVFNAICTGEKVKPESNRVALPRCEESGHFDIDKVAQLIQQGIPVSFSFCDNFLMSGVPDVADISQCDGSHIHAALLIGQRMNPQTHSCEYLLRNSWGANCYGIRSGFNCEGGQVWLSSSALRFNSLSLSWVH